MRGEGGLAGSAPRPRRRRALWLLAAPGLVGLVVLLILLAPAATVEWSPLADGATSAGAADSPAQQEKQLVSERDKLRKRAAALIPRDPYIIVNTSENRLYLMQGPKLLREAVISTGSYKYLDAPDGRHWLFTTPRGLHRVKGKQQHPVWIKPDWAFIEEGEPIPDPGAPERYEEGALGMYALALGDGYLIHGTLYTRLLGTSVTHGCIRVGDEDLEAVYQAASVGTKVFIY